MINKQINQQQISTTFIQKEKSAQTDGGGQKCITDEAREV